MKTHLLDVNYLYDDDGYGISSYYSKGHHDSEAFVIQVLQEFEECIPVTGVKHKYMRWSLAGRYEGENLEAVEYNTSGKGRFPVTIYNVR